MFLARLAVPRGASTRGLTLPRRNLGYQVVLVATRAPGDRSATITLRAPDRGPSPAGS